MSNLDHIRRGREYRWFSFRINIRRPPTLMGSQEDQRVGGMLMCRRSGWWDSRIVVMVSNTDSHCKPDLDHAQALALELQLLSRLYQISQVGGIEKRHQKWEKVANPCNELMSYSTLQTKQIYQGL